jgi:hypothetical protein
LVRFRAQKRREVAVRRFTLSLITAVAFSGLAVPTVQAQEGGGCKEVGQLAAELARAPGPLGADVSELAQAGGVNEFVLETQAALCQP